MNSQKTMMNECNMNEKPTTEEEIVEELEVETEYTNSPPAPGPLCMVGEDKSAHEGKTEGQVNAGVEGEIEGQVNAGVEGEIEVEAGVEGEADVSDDTNSVPNEVIHEELNRDSMEELSRDSICIDAMVDAFESGEYTR